VIAVYKSAVYVCLPGSARCGDWQSGSAIGFRRLRRSGYAFGRWDCAIRQSTYAKDVPLLGEHFVSASCRVYRAMHVVLARYCYRKSSVRPCVCLSVYDVDVC